MIRSSFSARTNRASDASSRTGVAGRLLGALATMLIVATAAGCSLGQSTEGARGRVDFSFSQFDGCFFGCAITHAVLAGAKAEMSVANLDPDQTYFARSATPASAAITDPLGCEDRTCFHFTLDAKTAGDVTIEVVSEQTGAVIDFTVIKIRDAATVETTVKDSAGHDLPRSPFGEVEVRQGTEIDLVNVARSGTGTELHMSSSGFSIAYSDETVVGPRFVLFGATRTENAIARAPGIGTVTVGAGNARRAVAFRVVP